MAAMVHTPKKSTSPARLNTTNSPRVRRLPISGAAPRQRAILDPAERQRGERTRDGDAAHAHDDHRGEDVEARLVEHVSQPEDGADQLARDERGPARLHGEP